MDVYYWYRKSAKEPDKGTIYGVVRIDGIVSVPFSTGLKVERKNWNANEQTFEGKGSALLEAKKSVLEKRLREILQQLQEDAPRTQIDPNSVIDVHRNLKAMSKAEKSFNFQEVIRMYIKHQEELVRVGKLAADTIEGYIKRQKNIVMFLESKKYNKIPTIGFDEQIADEFQHWMHLRRMSQYYINKHLVLIKTIQSFAVRKKIALFRPLEKYKLVTVKEKLPVPLQITEIKKVEEFKFNKLLQPVADAWLFCAETSLAYTDYMTLTNAMLAEDEDGTFWIQKHRNKSEQLQLIPLSAKAIAIIQKYGGELESLPRYCNQTMNSYLKEIAKFAGVNEKLHFHMARKTFAHISLNHKKMREATIAQVMGWSTTKELKVYARLNQQAIKEEFFKEGE